jgi:hypothetical protein
MSHYNQQGYGFSGYGTTHANESSAGFISGQSGAPYGRNKQTSKWLKFGLPALVLALIAGGVVVAVILTRKKSSDSDSSSSSGSGSSSGNAKNAAIFPTATNSQFSVPIYPSATNTALYTEPTFASSKASVWPSDSFAPSNPSVKSVRPDRPRLIAPRTSGPRSPSS